MRELTQNQTDRQDFVDGAIFDCIQRVNPTAKEIAWDIEMIGDVRDEIEYWLTERLKLTTKQKFYPSIVEKTK